MLFRYFSCKLHFTTCPQAVSFLSKWEVEGFKLCDLETRGIAAEAAMRLELSVGGEGPPRNRRRLPVHTAHPCSRRRLLPTRQPPSVSLSLRDFQGHFFIGITVFVPFCHTHSPSVCSPPHTCLLILQYTFFLQSNHRVFLLSDLSNAIPYVTSVQAVSPPIFFWFHSACATFYHPFDNDMIPGWFGSSKCFFLHS